MLKCTAAWVSVDTTLTVEMPVRGKHEKAMKPFPTLPTALGNSSGHFSHSHRLDYDGIYFSIPSGLETRGLRARVKRLPGPFLSGKGISRKSRIHSDDIGVSGYLF